jgi:hypothetical protein
MKLGSDQTLDEKRGSGHQSDWHCGGTVLK